jgi:hypothetical protein
MIYLSISRLEKYCIDSKTIHLVFEYVDRDLGQVINSPEGA